MKKMSHTSPICFFPNGNLVCYRYGMLYVLEEGKIVGKYRLFSSFEERVLAKSKLYYRLKRLGIRTAIALDDDNILISVKNVLYEYCFSKNSLSKGYTLPVGIRPLIFTNVKELKGFADGVVFGGYLGNSMKKPVNIYRRVSTNDWEVVHTFAQGEINHIHNIVADKYRECLWVFTGDFDDAAAIWKVSDDFNKVEKICGGNQKYRACVVFPIKEGLLYATDTPFANNHIYVWNVHTLQLRSIGEIAGSCIYGCKWKNQYVLSSTVEPDGRNQSLKGLLFNRKRGSGIKDDSVHLYCGDCENGFREIYSAKKDYLPFIFQFGVFKFPNGVNNSDTLYFQPIATKKNDVALMDIKNVPFE